MSTDCTEIASKLHEYEKRILLALGKKDGMTEERLAEATGLSTDSVAHSSLRLSSKGLVRIKETKEELVKLDREGEEYRREGLPERNALNAIKKGVNTAKGLEGKLGERKSKIALVWLVRKKLAIIKGGGLELAPEGKKAMKEKLPEEDLLDILHRGDKIPDKMKPILKLLEKRGKIIKTGEKVTRVLSLTDDGRKLLKAGLKIRKETGVLTSSLIKSGKWKKQKFRKYDLKAPVPVLHAAKKQPYRRILDETRELLIAMGFREIRGPLVETEFWNFDALFQAQDHPSREVHDTYGIKNNLTGKLPAGDYVKRVKATHENGWETGSSGWRYEWDQRKAVQLMMRSHTTAVTVRGLYEAEGLPVKVFTVSRNFRPDVIDATHLPEFYQCDGIVGDESITFRDLLGLLKEFAREVANAKKVRFQPAYFPYTEPSVELFAKHPEIGWMELGGAGMFRPEVILPTGKKNAEVIAWGLGVDRLAMFRLGLSDIRNLFSVDLNWLRNTTVWGRDG
jgi:phenylalanyl-tRNA synthetase alpha chain